MSKNRMAFVQHPSIPRGVLIPQNVLDAAQMNPQELQRELALTLYAQQRLSLGQARELAGLSLWEFRQWLGLRRIAAHYDSADLQDDLDTLRDLGRLA